VSDAHDLNRHSCMKILFNGEAHEAAAGATVGQLLRELRVSSQRCAVEVNLEVVPRAQLEEFRLSDGDRVEVVTLVGGG
jgi:sulfur carrier protein